MNVNNKPGKWPLLSIITVVYNGANSLEKTIKSVIDQSYSNIEYIIIDGASQDETLDIIDKYKSQISYWISEKDQGVYDAMNKGIAAAKGDWLLFLGSDDILANNKIVSDIFAVLLKEGNQESFSLIVGNVKYSNGRLMKSQFSSRLKNKNMIHHQGAFYKRGIFIDFKYDPNYKISSDYQLNLKLFLQNAHCLKIDKVVSICGAAGLSSVASWSGYSEEIKIRNQYLTKPESIIYNFLTILRFLIKKTIIIILLGLRQPENQSKSF
jgi:glycosyltransferase involved in cell wall biosynthesis